MSLSRPLVGLTIRRARDPFAPGAWLRRAYPLSPADLDSQPSRVERLTAAFGRGYFFSLPNGRWALVRGCGDWVEFVAEVAGTSRPLKFGSITPLMPLPEPEALQLLKRLVRGLPKPDLERMLAVLEGREDGNAINKGTERR